MNYRELPEISDKLTEIVDLVFKFRFINRRQLQTYFGHKDPSRLNKWLKELVEKKYLGRIFSNRLLENTKPAIYYLGNNGIIHGKWRGMEAWGYDDLDFTLFKKYYQDKYASQSFIAHSMIIFDIYLQYIGVKNLPKNKKRNIEFYFEAKSEMWIRQKLSHRQEGDFEEIKDLIPDVHFERSKFTKDDIEIFSWYIILFDPHVPRYAIRYKIDRYIEAFEESKGEEIEAFGDEFPTLLLIFPSGQKAAQIAKHFRKKLIYSTASKMQIYTSTVQKIRTDGLGGGEKTWKSIKAVAD